VQLSGRIVRNRLARENGSNLRCLYYGNAPGIHHDADCVPSRLKAARRALDLRDRDGDAIFWHLSMLRLLPALGPQRRKYLFLHGIECWRPLDAVTQHLLRHIDVFLCNSAFTWNYFIEKNPRWIRSAHRIVSLGAGAPDPSAALPGPIPAALIVGRMERGEAYKGHEELIRIWPRVGERLPGAELWIAGGGSLEAELKSIVAQAGEAAHVRFFGVIPDEEKERLIVEARCLVMPSKGEGFGLAYLEAMRHGRPCLSSTLDAGREIVNAPEAGLSVDPDQTGALCDALVRLLTPGPEWDHWSANARSRYESRYTAAHFEDRLLAALDRRPPQ
jgi:phosphatidyl-myo-inositol dimannoside synthase